MALRGGGGRRMGHKRRAPRNIRIGSETSRGRGVPKLDPKPKGKKSAAASYPATATTPRHAPHPGSAGIAPVSCVAPHAVSRFPVAGCRALVAGWWWWWWWCGRWSVAAGGWWVPVAGGSASRPRSLGDPQSFIASSRLSSSTRCSRESRTGGGCVDEEPLLR